MGWPTALDPILLVGRETNLYEYARSDPVNLMDRDGRQWQWAAGQVAKYLLLPHPEAGTGENEEVRQMHEQQKTDWARGQLKGADEQLKNLEQRINDVPHGLIPNDSNNYEPNCNPGDKPKICYVEYEPGKFIRVACDLYEPRLGPLGPFGRFKRSRGYRRDSAVRRVVARNAATPSSMLAADTDRAVRRSVGRNTALVLEDLLA
jgi:hypothetical protein